MKADPIRVPVRLYLKVASLLALAGSAIAIVAGVSELAPWTGDAVLIHLVAGAVYCLATLPSDKS